MRHVKSLNFWEIFVFGRIMFSFWEDLHLKSDIFLNDLFLLLPVQSVKQITSKF